MIPASWRLPLAIILLAEKCPAFLKMLATRKHSVAISEVEICLRLRLVQGNLTHYQFHRLFLCSHHHHNLSHSFPGFQRTRKRIDRKRTLWLPFLEATLSFSTAPPKRQCCAWWLMMPRLLAEGMMIHFLKIKLESLMGSLHFSVICYSVFSCGRLGCKEYWGSLYFRESIWFLFE